MWRSDSDRRSQASNRLSDAPTRHEPALSRSSAAAAAAAASSNPGGSGPSSPREQATTRSIATSS